MTRALITGGAGFLGRHLVAHLRESEPDMRLRLLCRASVPACHDPAIEIVRGDVTDAASVLAAMDGVDVVYHLAGRVSGWRADRRTLMTTHIEGARNVCAAAARCRPAQIVFVSTSGTLAVSTRPVVHDEQAGYPHALVNRWPYYLSKVFAEKLVLSATAEHALPTVVVNPTLLLGPDGGQDSTNGALTSFLSGRLPAVPRGGVSLVDVRDVAAILPVAARRGRAGERYILTAANWSLRELAGRLARLAGRPARRVPGLPAPLLLAAAVALRLAPQVGRAIQLDGQSLEIAAHYWYADAAKACAELGFAPRDPTETLAAAVHDLRLAGLTR